MYYCLVQIEEIMDDETLTCTHCNILRYQLQKIVISLSDRRDTYQSLLEDAFVLLSQINNHIARLLFTKNYQSYNFGINLHI